MHNLTLALHFLTRCMRYDVLPNQDLGIDLSRMPTRPCSGFIITGVRATAELSGRAPRLPSPSATRTATGGDSRPRPVASTPS
jgi:hypothetical protein